MSRAHLGYSAGVLGTITLADWHLIAGIIFGAIVALCAIPDGIAKWRKTVYEYKIWQAQTGFSGVRGVLGFCLGWLQSRRQDDPAQIPLKFPNNRND